LCLSSSTNPSVIQALKSPIVSGHGTWAFCSSQLQFISPILDTIQNWLACIYFVLILAMLVELITWGWHLMMAHKGAGKREILEVVNSRW
jgi:hypothetical protein